MHHCPCRRLPPSLSSRAMLLFAILLAAVVSGCTSPAKFQPVSGSGQFPPYEGKVKVLENMPSQNQFTRVGVVSVEGVQLTKESNMVSALKDKAAENGANAVVMQAPLKVETQPNGSIRKKLAAWAIRLK
jgi:hypothetical protein